MEEMLPMLLEASMRLNQGKYKFLFHQVHWLNTWANIIEFLFIWPKT